MVLNAQDADMVARAHVRTYAAAREKLLGCAAPPYVSCLLKPLTKPGDPGKQQGAYA